MLLSDEEKEFLKLNGKRLGLPLATFIKSSAIQKANQINFLWKKAENGNLKISDIEKHELSQEVLE